MTSSWEVLSSNSLFPFYCTTLDHQDGQFRRPCCSCRRYRCVCFSASLSIRSSPGLPLSGTQKVPVLGGWFLHVSLLLRCVVCYVTQLPTPSWEFMTTLGYEWDIIQKRLRYRWSIWVRNDSPFLFCVILVGKKSDMLTW